MKKTIRKKLRNRISLFGYSEYEIAELLGISQNEFSMIVTGKRKRFKKSHIKALLDILNCNARDILSMTDLLRYQRETKKELKIDNSNTWRIHKPPRAGFYVHKAWAEKERIYLCNSRYNKWVHRYSCRNNTCVSCAF